jgi:hypothetical protein
MIKIERSTAVNATIVRNDVRQPVTLNMTVTQAELDSLQADSGTITYSVDELEVKTVDFQPKQSTPAPVIKPVTVAVTDTVVTTTVAKPIIQPARKTTKATQA